MQSGDLGGAADALKTILKSSPKHLEANLNLGMIYALQSRFSLALGHLSTAVAQNNQLPDAHQLMGDCFRGQRNPVEAAKAYKKAVAFNPRSMESWFNLGLMQKENKDFEGAVAAFQKAIELQPEFRKAHEWMGLTLIDSGNYIDGLSAVAKGSGFIEFNNKGSETYRLVTS